MMNLPSPAGFDDGPNIPESIPVKINETTAMFKMSIKGVTQCGRRDRSLFIPQGIDGIRRGGSYRLKSHGGQSRGQRTSSRQ